ncbi:hypothetical protein AAY473_005948 [Plecturocebus cupreus]
MNPKGNRMMARKMPRKTGHPPTTTMELAGYRVTVRCGCCRAGVVDGYPCDRVGVGWQRGHGGDRASRLQAGGRSCSRGLCWVVSAVRTCQVHT